MKSEISEYIKDKQEEYQGFKEMLVGKLEGGELTSATLERVVEEIYNIGHYVGHCRGEQYSRNLVASYAQKINELEERIHAQY